MPQDDLAAKFRAGILKLQRIIDSVQDPTPGLLRCRERLSQIDVDFSREFYKQESELRALILTPDGAYEPGELELQLEIWRRQDPEKYETYRAQYEAFCKSLKRGNPVGRLWHDAYKRMFHREIEED